MEGREEELKEEEEEEEEEKEEEKSVIGETTWKTIFGPQRGKTTCVLYSNKSLGSQFSLPFRATSCSWTY